MNILEAAQGSPAWHAHRASHFNASDAPAMMGLSPHKTRSQLIHELATGITPEIDPATQRRFDDGHRFEALARPIAEKILGEDLYPVVGYEGMLSASFDGLTMDGTVCFEHKTLNAAYREAIATGSTLPPALLVQIEQQLMLADATRCLFMASRWNDDDTLAEEVHCFVESDPELRKALLQGWTQLAIDRDAYVHVEQAAAPTAATIEALPALFVQVEGKVLATNLDAFKAAAQTFIDGIKTELVNDQDFADADKMVKFLKDGEERLALAKQQALAQTASIDELFRTVDAISEQMRSKRLALDKLVKAEKINRKAAIISEARKAMFEHVDKLNERIGGRWMPVFTDAIFAEAVAGLKSLDSMRDKVSTALAQAKIEANEIADRIEANRKVMEQLCDPILFPDFAAVCTKAADDFAALVALRVSQDVQRKEAEREKIRQEEADKLAAPQAPAASTLPIQQSDMGQSLDGLAGKSVRAPEQTFTSERVGEVVNESMIDDFLRLLATSATEKKALRAMLVKFETYRIKMAAAHDMARAA